MSEMYSSSYLQLCISQVSHVKSESTGAPPTAQRCAVCSVQRATHAFNLHKLNLCLYYAVLICSCADFPDPPLHSPPPPLPSSSSLTVVVFVCVRDSCQMSLTFAVGSRIIACSWWHSPVRAQPTQFAASLSLLLFQLQVQTSCQRREGEGGGARGANYETRRRQHLLA